MWSSLCLALTHFPFLNLASKALHNLALTGFLLPRHTPCPRHTNCTPPVQQSIFSTSQTERYAQDSSWLNPTRPALSPRNLFLNIQLRAISTTPNIPQALTISTTLLCLPSICVDSRYERKPKAAESQALG